MKVDLAKPYPHKPTGLGALGGCPDRNPHELILRSIKAHPTKFYLQDAGVNREGFDRGGTYWGTNVCGAFKNGAPRSKGKSVYLAQDYEGHVFRSYRIQSRRQAINLLKREFPLAIVKRCIRSRRVTKEGSP